VFDPDKLDDKTVQEVLDAITAAGKMGAAIVPAQQIAVFRHLAKAGLFEKLGQDPKDSKLPLTLVAVSCFINAIFVGKRIGLGMEQLIDLVQEVLGRANLERAEEHLSKVPPKAGEKLLSDEELNQLFEKGFD
jgi:hypothetical protein